MGNLYNVQLYVAWFILTITNMLAATYSILTCGQLYNPQNIPLLFVIIFLSYSTPTNDEYSTTSARWDRILIKLIGRRFIKYVNHLHTAEVQTPVSPPRCCQCSNQKYDPGCPFKNRPYTWKQYKSELACSWMWVYPHHGKWQSINHITYSGCTLRATWPIYCCP